MRVVGPQSRRAFTPKGWINFVSGIRFPLSPRAGCEGGSRSRTAKVLLNSPAALAGGIRQNIIRYSNTTYPCMWSSHRNGSATPNGAIVRRRRSRSPNSFSNRLTDDTGKNITCGPK